MISQVDSKSIKLVETENRMVVSWGWGVEEMERCLSKVQTFNYKMNKLWRSKAQCGGSSEQYCDVYSKVATRVEV